MPVPDFSPGEILTAAAMDRIGLYHITTVTPTAATIIAVDGCFTSSFTNYRIMISPVGATLQTDIRIKLRASGTPSSVEYYMTNIFAYGGSISSSSENALSSWRGIFTGANQGLYGTLSFDVYSPQVAASVSRYQMTSSGWDTNFVTNRSATGFHAQTVSYDGFELLSTTAGANITATISVYGYNKG
jgi:hypothetical protein